jgi:hypothetical protein
MEIQIDLGNKRLFFGMMIGIGIALLLVGLAFLGKPFSPLAPEGSPRLISWQDWQTLKIQQQYEKEIAILRSDADALAILLNQSPAPVAAQVLESRIAQNTTDGLSALQPARLAVAQASRDVLSWSSGTLDRNAAAASLSTAVELLK